jgi:hypothetical protein
MERCDGVRSCSWLNARADWNEGKTGLPAKVTYKETAAKITKRLHNLHTKKGKTIE